MKRLLQSILLLAVIGIVVAAAYLQSTGLSARSQPSSIEAFLALKARSFAIPAASRQANNPVPSNADALSEAMHHYADHCATCHANDGSGDMPVGRGLYPRPPDLRLAATQRLTDGELYWVIRNGVRFTGMPAFGDEKLGIQDEDSWKLVHFVRHLPKITEQELQAMKQSNPISRAELDEEEQNRRFLAGEDTPAEAQHSHD